ncbi:hypothetical protein GIB67_038544 [Kingdonia uniflora]|uniref:Uncharacterized protein n=1 Tax=Kingdonia uniflora TaxID=39325 RepID=A0A7J7NPA7_9MAGN|nr:hypothetical protein GIB67_038544 [Kingdonia uniflora]
MYAMRLLLMYRKDPSFLSTPPSEFLHSGYLIVTDEESEQKMQAWTCSTEEDMSTCCFSTYVNDVKLTDFEYRNIYQQVEIFNRGDGDFVVKSVVPDGFPPYFLGGKRYTHENEERTKDNNIKVMDLKLLKEEVSLYGVKAMKMDETCGMIWYKQVTHNGEGLNFRLSSVIAEKMKLIQENGGWIGGGDVRVDKVEEFKGENGWKRFRCFVLVERFSLRSLDGNSMLTCDFKHIHHIQSRWE